MARIQILTKEEQKIFSEAPIFTYLEKEYYFKLPDALHEFVKTLRNTNNEVYWFVTDIRVQGVI